MALYSELNADKHWGGRRAFRQIRPQDSFSGFVGREEDDVLEEFSWLISDGENNNIIL